MNVAKVGEKQTVECPVRRLCTQWPIGGLVLRVTTELTGHEMKKYYFYRYY